MKSISSAQVGKLYTSKKKFASSIMQGQVELLQYSREPCNQRRVANLARISALGEVRREEGDELFDRETAKNVID